MPQRKNPTKIFTEYGKSIMGLSQLQEWRKYTQEMTAQALGLRMFLIFTRYYENSTLPTARSRERRAFWRSSLLETFGRKGVQKKPKGQGA